MIPNIKRRSRIIYSIMSLIVNLSMCFVGHYSLGLGLFIMVSPSTLAEIIIGGSIFLGTFIIAIILNVVIYFSFLERAAISIKWVIIQISAIIIIGILYTVYILR